jgi:hypothetical protein
MQGSAFMAENPSLETVLSELDAEYTGKLPVRAIQEAQRRGTEMVPHLIDLIRKATEAARAGNAPKGNGHLFALYLLTEFRAKEALAPIVEAVSLPGEGPFDLFGDSITEDLNRVLAVLAVDEPGLIDTLVADRSLNEYVRWQAARTYLHWVRDGRLTRQEAVRRLRDHLRKATENGDYETVSGLVSELVSYSPRECRDEIEEAFRQGLVDEAMVGSKTVSRSLTEGESWFHQALQCCRPADIEDTVAELKNWACFQETDPPRTTPRLHATPSAVEDDARDYRFDRIGAWQTEPSGRQDNRHVGRNAPCPCGSGKKYKKCCGRNTA